MAQSWADAVEERTKKVYRNLTIMIKHIQVSNLTQEKLQKLILEYRDIIESSSDFLTKR